MIDSAVLVRGETLNNDLGLDIAERMIFMDGGRIVGELTRAEIESEPGLLDQYLSVGY